ncbi:winged helix-turn-helix domain-containing protein [Stakelama marina]|uniref:LysR family transcriptional regulator n=1 Tax=Stakelama marina TaxID=2826939 RepID=A0A8T4I8L8_9SPHN|nr:LysR family transcriptional regulator [Stakelama marina]MBR0551007.1 LysR family transcriptional regulator [Stakelama marina]
MRIGPLKIKAQLYCGDEIAMGPGKADLLDAIDREGSISRAAAAMGMSYRRAWLLVDSMNRCFTAPLVETHAGGGKASGARLSDTGRTVLTLYRRLESNLGLVGDTDPLAMLEAALREEPLAHRAP